MAGRRLDLAIGIALGVVLGVAIAYALVVAVGDERDASDISNPAQPQGGAETRTRPGDRSSP